MPFRADEAAQTGYKAAESFLIPKSTDASDNDRRRCKEALEDLAARLGPVITAYPSWHPLVCHHDDRDFVSEPCPNCGYRGLEHTRYFANGFITCPFDDGQEVLDSVQALSEHPAASIRATKLDVPFYKPGTTAILVECNWKRELEEAGTIPLSLAAPLMLQKAIPSWQWSRVAETWDNMRPYFLGQPHGKRSSLFVNQETGQGLKNIWNELIHTGMFGPVKN